MIVKRGPPSSRICPGRTGAPVGTGQPGLGTTAAMGAWAKLLMIMVMLMATMVVMVVVIIIIMTCIVA